MEGVEEEEESFDFGDCWLAGGKSASSLKLKFSSRVDACDISLGESGKCATLGKSLEKCDRFHSCRNGVITRAPSPICIPRHKKVY